MDITAKPNGLNITKQRKTREIMRLSGEALRVTNRGR
jgi:hypothetical protein